MAKLQRINNYLGSCKHLTRFPTIAFNLNPDIIFRANASSVIKDYFHLMNVGTLIKFMF